MTRTGLLSNFFHVNGSVSLDDFRPSVMSAQFWLAAVCARLVTLNSTSPSGQVASPRRFAVLAVVCLAIQLWLFQVRFEVMEPVHHSSTTRAEHDQAHHSWVRKVALSTCFPLIFD